MPRALDRQAVRDWLSGQRAAAEHIATERVRFLLSVAPERFLQIYLELCALDAGEPPKSPSPVLFAMRRALSRMEEKGKR
ncbi:hypothetical protein ACVNPS_07145 [Candidatus Bipolaricaulota sp. J31]